VRLAGNRKQTPENGSRENARRRNGIGLEAGLKKRQQPKDAREAAADPQRKKPLLILL